MENNVLKQIVFLLIGFFCTVAMAQDLEQLGYHSLQKFEYEEITKDGIPKTMNGNFIVTSRSEGSVRFLAIRHFKDGKKEGEWKSFGANEYGIGLRLFFVANYQKGLLNGYYSFYNDTHSETGVYKNGKKHGKWEYYKSDNDSEEKITYKDDVKYGAYSLKEDTTIITGQYKKGKKDGVWIIKDTGTYEVNKEFYKKGKLEKKLEISPFD